MDSTYVLHTYLAIDPGLCGYNALSYNTKNSEMRSKITFSHVGIISALASRIAKDTSFAAGLYKAT